MVKIGLPGAVFLVFLTLKLTGVLAWSWWWVTAPLWAGFVFAMGVWILGITLAVLVGATAVTTTKSRSNYKNHSTF